jgi:hypothetical protein
MEDLVKGVAFAVSKGVAEMGTAVWVNGLLVTSSEGVPWEQMVPYQLQVEQQRLQVGTQAAHTSAAFQNIKFITCVHSCMETFSCCSAEAQVQTSICNLA